MAEATVLWSVVVFSKSGPHEGAQGLLAQEPILFTLADSVCTVS